eukprot:scaffold47501_cov19-Tisochrysis_lutea.AAC.2
MGQRVLSRVVYGESKRPTVELSSSAAAPSAAAAPVTHKLEHSMSLSENSGAAHLRHGHRLRVKKTSSSSSSSNSNSRDPRAPHELLGKTITFASRVASGESKGPASSESPPTAAAHELQQPKSDPRVTHGLRAAHELQRFSAHHEELREFGKQVNASGDPQRFGPWSSASLIKVWQSLAS